MIGINVNKINSAISKIDNFSELVDSNVKSITECISDLSNSYSGNDINFLFQDIVEEIKSIKKITSVVNNYSDVLTDVVDAYEAQDANVKNKYNVVTNETNII